MKRLIIIAPVLFLSACLSLKAIAETNNIIDSLLLALPSLKDSAKVECFSELGRQYADLCMGPPGSEHFSANSKTYCDSSIYFIRAALSESRRINYVHGVVFSLGGEMFLQINYYVDLPTAETVGREGIEWCQKSGDKRGLCFLYTWLGFALFSQSKYDEAIAMEHKAIDCHTENNQQFQTIVPLSVIGHTYRESGDFDKAFVVFRKCRDLAESLNNEDRLIEGLFDIASLYAAI